MSGDMCERVNVFYVFWDYDLISRSSISFVIVGFEIGFCIKLICFSGIWSVGERKMFFFVWVVRCEVFFVYLMVICFIMGEFVCLDLLCFKKKVYVSLWESNYFRL